MSLARHALLGAIAGAAATSALNIATYADIALRGRAESDVPSVMVKNAAEAAGIGALASDDETAQHRRSGIGALAGYANGIGVGVLYGALRPASRGLPVLLAGLLAGAAAMALSDAAIAKSGASDPRTWAPGDWVADALPHVAYGVALALSFDALDR
jgi:hypothetical protein